MIEKDRKNQIRQVALIASIVRGYNQKQELGGLLAEVRKRREREMSRRSGETLPYRLPHEIGIEPIEGFD